MAMTNAEYQRRYREKHPEKVKERSKRYSETNPEWRLMTKAKYRAKKSGKDFNLEVVDVIIPETCPVLGIPLFKGVGKVHDNSPSLDRIDQTQGYIKGNVAVISYQANRLKSNLTLDQLDNLVRYMKKET